MLKSYALITFKNF